MAFCYELGSASLSGYAQRAFFALAPRRRKLASHFYGPRWDSLVALSPPKPLQVAESRKSRSATCVSNDAALAFRPCLVAAMPAARKKFSAEAAERSPA